MARTAPFWILIPGCAPASRYHSLYLHANYLHGTHLGCAALLQTSYRPVARCIVKSTAPALIQEETVSKRDRSSVPRRSAVTAGNPVEQPTAAATADASGSIGRVARRLREDLGLTLAIVAQRANISPGMLSRLENGQVSPSLETIVALSQVLRVRPMVLLQEVGDVDGDAQHVPSGQGLEVVRRGTKRGHTYHLLAAQRGPRKVFEPFLVTLTDKSEIFPGFQHAGTEFIHILSGEIRYRHGKDSYLLKEGDSLTFRGDVAHGPERLLRVPIRMLSIIIYSENQPD
jgi:DNA-binding XRE family transcriptional regulator